MSSDIKAGGAYVEIGATTTALEKGLKEARQKLQDFGTQLAGIGARMAAIGAVMTAPIIAAAKSFADSGEQIQKIQAQTGMSTEAISALSSMARQSGTSIESVAHGMKALQVNIATGGDAAEKSFARLGTSSKELAQKSPEEALGLLADRLQLVTDQNEKAALAQSIFGIGASEMRPFLDQGSEGLNRAAQSAAHFGTLMDKNAAAAAARMDDAFDGLAESAKGFGDAIAAAVEPVLIPLIDDITEAVVAMGDWIKKNPQAVQSFFDIGVAMSRAGAALAVIGASIAALMSPILLAAAGIGIIVGALMAVLDVLGITDTGFGAFFNSIRIGGRGLGTWMGELSLSIQKSINWIWDKFSDFLAGYWKRERSRFFPWCRSFHGWPKKVWLQSTGCFRASKKS